MNVEIFCNFYTRELNVNEMVLVLGLRLSDIILFCVNCMWCMWWFCFGDVNVLKLIDSFGALIKGDVGALTWLFEVNF